MKSRYSIHAFGEEAIEAITPTVEEQAMKAQAAMEVPVESKQSNLAIITDPDTDQVVGVLTNVAESMTAKTTTHAQKALETLGVKQKISKKQFQLLFAGLGAWYAISKLKANLKPLIMIGGAFMAYKYRDKLMKSTPIVKQLPINA
jgi:hypothetical protein